MSNRTSLVLAVLLVACAKPDAGTTDTAAAPTAPNVVLITASDFSFAMPDTIPAGMTTFRLVTSGTNIHHATISRIGEGKTFADFESALRTSSPTSPPPTWITAVGGPNPPAVGDTSVVTQMLEPGTYAVVCFVDTPDKVPHFTKGMMKQLVVRAADAPSAPSPVADISMTLKDYAFDISPALTAGRHTVKVDNIAQQDHEFFLFKLDSGKTADDLMKWGEKYEGPPPGIPMGGLAGLSPGSTAFVELDLTPGNYLLVCFVPASDGKPHLAHGMMMPLAIN